MTTYNSTILGGSLDAQIYIANDTNTNSVDYLTAGGIQGLDLYVQLGPGDGSAGPKFVAGVPVTAGPNGQAGNSPYVMNGADPITGTIFASNHSPAGDGGFSTNQLIQVTMNTSSGVVIPPDLGSTGVLLATLHITIPAGLAPGSDWGINITGTGSQQLNATDWSDGGNFNRDQDNNLFGLFNGNIHIAAVPEPASVVLGLMAIAGFGLVALRRRRAA